MIEEGMPKDQYEAHHGEPEGSIERNVKSKATWLRLVFMLVMMMLFSIGAGVGCFVVMLQFFWVLFTGEANNKLTSVGRQLAEYVKEVVLYLSFNTDERPFPFDRDWPAGAD